MPPKFDNSRVFDSVEAFRRRHGRAPRVLHIGNIANNAYLNAKFLRAAGVECDVLCHDYYHIMGCPEWEEVEFDPSGIRDQNRPNWSRVALRGYRRPRWFVQGPLRSCLRYLSCRNRGKKRSARLAWWGLSLHNRTRDDFFARPVFRLIEIFRKIRQFPAWLYYHVTLRLYPLWKSLSKKPAKEKAPAKCSEGPDGPLAFWEREFARLFPDREDRLTLDDRKGFTRNLPAFREAFDRYDIVVAYALEGVWPLLAGKRPYLCFEHGTIRSIPFQPTPQGRLCALTYRLADMVLITNADNRQAAEKLRLEPYCFIPHPVSEWQPPADETTAARRKDLLTRCDADFLVFHPARQHWEPRRHPSWEKGNDIFIRGFARFIKEIRPRAAAIFVEWGRTVEASKRLLAELGVSDRVLWIAPQPSRSMARYIRACDLLADQFFLGAFGSTLPKALLHETPVMLYLNEARHRWCFPQPPPVLNAADPTEVFEGLRRLVEKNGFREKLARDGRAWYRAMHSNRVIAERFARVFQQVSLEKDAETAHEKNET